MSVRFQYAGDKDISVGRAGGASLFSLPGPIGCPSAGTTLSISDDVVFPIGNGGSQVGYQDPDTLTTYYVPSQTCDVPVKADGSCGTYLDWANVTDVKPIASNTFAASISGLVNMTAINTNCNSIQNVVNGTYTRNWYHDGSMGLWSEAGAISALPNGTQLYYEECYSEEYGTTTTTYFSDGIGGVYTA